MGTKKTFDFKLDDDVEIIVSGERGTVIGRAHYTYANPTYLVRYKAGDGRMVECWINEDALKVEPR